MTEELSRTSALADRHRALGSGLEDWNGMGTAWTYSTNPNDEHDAVRESAGLFDMSPLKKVFVRGADARAVIDRTISRDCTKIGEGRSAYGAVLTEQGTVADDAIVSNNGGEEWMFVHGSGDSMALLEASAEDKDVTVTLDDDLHDLSLQGPKALELLNAHTPFDIASLGYFEHAPITLFGHPCRISRTGYSGERGYEIFARADVAGDIWDKILDHGKPLGVMPCSFTALDKVRIEAALLFYGYDMTDEHFPTEVGLGFTLAKGSEYRGKEAALGQKGKERFVAAGIAVDHSDMIAGGETLRLNGEDVGVVNSPAYSHRLGKSLALVHMHPEAAMPDAALEVIGEGATYTATVRATPFFDPEKARTRS